MPTIHPLNKHVVVKRADPVRKQGALYLPDNASEKPQHAEVMAVDINQDGGPKVSVGDIVLLPKWSGVEVEYNGRTFLLVKEDDILAVIGQEVPSPVGPTLNDFFKYSPEWADVVTTDSEWANLLMESVLEVSGGDVHYAAGLDKTRHAFNVFLAHDSGLRGERADRFASVLRDAAVAFDKRMATTTRLATGDMVPAQQAEPAQAPRPTHDGPGRFRKKPVEIDAVLWDGQEDTLDTIVRWSSGAELKVASREWGYTLTIPTLEGEMNASLGDWIIRGVKGEVYPCKPDIFAATYEAVN